ncbi:MAG: hypothetical protein QY304_00980 [Candidatus Paceibacterota bacterium]|nr:MAG: hypothetical protein QY304_00980 [Candidatus Paceibacterota bacterium]
MRTAEEVMMRCKLILDQPDIVLLVDKSSSPTAAYDMVMDATHNDETAKAARWLGVLRRDYPDRYAEITHNTLSHVQRNTARKGERNENDVCS